MSLIKADDYKSLKLELSGYMKPGQPSVHRNVLLEQLYASMPRDPQAKVQVYNAEIAAGGFTNMHCHNGATFFVASRASSRRISRRACSSRRRPATSTPSRSARCTAATTRTRTAVSVRRAFVSRRPTAITSPTSSRRGRRYYPLADCRISASPPRPVDGGCRHDAVDGHRHADQHEHAEAGAPVATSHQPPPATSRSRTVPPAPVPAPCPSLARRSRDRAQGRTVRRTDRRPRDTARQVSITAGSSREKARPHVRPHSDQQADRPSMTAASARPSRPRGGRARHRRRRWPCRPSAPGNADRKGDRHQQEFQPRADAVAGQRLGAEAGQQAGQDQHGQRPTAPARCRPARRP